MKQIMKYRGQNDAEAAEEAGNETMVDVGPETLTQQQFADDADINIIVHRFGVANEIMPEPVTDPAYYGDTSDTNDLGELLRRVNDARERFAELPSKLRNRFSNSPAELWTWLQESDNHEEAVRIGLLKRIKEEKPTEKDKETPTP